MAIQTINTTNFVIQYDDSVKNGVRQKRASALSATCEGDFVTLQAWFGVTGGFGSGNPVKVIIGGKPENGGANNFGYQTGGNTLMNLDPQDNNNNDALAGDIMGMLFVAELSEIMMGYRNQQHPPATWNAANSDGEGLSQLCALLLHPDGHHWYYSFPWVNTWLTNASRDQAALDYINQPEQTDKNSLSFGCALLFLFYLKDQLGHSVPDIIQKGAPNLETTYQDLTGESGARNAFDTLLDTYYPTDKTIPPLTTNDPFPLYDKVVNRQVYIHQTQKPNAPARVTAAGSAVQQAFIGCPEKEYSYTIFSTPQTLTCTASTVGFGLPIFTWVVNGVSIETSGTINFTLVENIDDPTTSTGERQKTEVVAVTCTLINVAGDASSTLALDFPRTTGHFDLTIQVSAHEEYASSTINSRTILSTVENEKLLWEDQHYEDQKECAKSFSQRMKRYLRYDPFFNIIRTLPDPPPDYRRVARQLQVIEGELQKIAAESPAVAKEVEAGLSNMLGIPTQALDAFSQQERGKE